MLEKGEAKLSVVEAIGFDTGDRRGETLLEEVKKVVDKTTNIRDISRDARRKEA